MGKSKKGARRAPKYDEHAAAANDDDVPLTGVGARDTTAEAAAVPANGGGPVDEGSSVNSNSAGRSNAPSRSDPGSSARVAAVVAAGGIMMLLTIGVVWCIVLVPVHAVNDVRSIPPDMGSVFCLSGCAVQINAARAIGGGWSARERTLDRIVSCKQTKSSVAGFDSDLETARMAVERDDYVAASDLVGAQLRRHLEAVRDKLGERYRTVAGPLAHVGLTAGADGFRRVAGNSVPNAPGVASSMSASLTSVQLAGGLGGTARIAMPFASRMGLPGNASATIRVFAEAAASAARDTAPQLRPRPATTISAATDASDVTSEAVQVIAAFEGVVDRSEEHAAATQRLFIADLAITRILLVVAAISCAVGVVIVAVLTRRYGAVEAYRSAIRSDFDIEEDSPTALPKAEVLRAFSLACAKLSVMDTAPDGAVDEDGSQVVLQLQRAKPTLGALRPFVPAFAFSRTDTFECFGREYHRLSMSPGLEVDQTCVVVAVGLRDFNNKEADPETLPKFLRIIQAATATYNGVLAQLTPSHAICVFPGRSENVTASMNDSSLRTGGVNAVDAVSAAFAMLAGGVRLQLSDDAGLAISIGIAQGCTLHGPLSTTHSLRVYGVVSHTVTTALHLESITRDLGTCIVCDHATAAVVDDAVLVRPVWLCPERLTTVHEVVMPLDDDRGSAEQRAVQERVARWAQCFERYEEAVNAMTHDKVEEAESDLVAYRHFVAAASGNTEAVEDVVYQRISEHVRRLITELKI